MKAYRAVIAALWFQICYHLFFFVFLIRLHQLSISQIWSSTAFLFANTVFILLPGLCLFAMYRRKGFGRSFTLLINTFLFFLFSFKLLSTIHTTEAEKILFPLRLMLVLIPVVILSLTLSKKLTKRWMERHTRRV